MGIPKKVKIILSNFLSNRTNLTLFQCVLYFVIGSIMGQYLSWGKMIVMFIVMFLIQFITRTKGVADGIVMGHLMKEHNIQTNEFLQRMKDEADKIDKEDLN